MNIDWSDLRTELAEWQARGLRLPVWWRDDDAVAPTPALSRLTKLSARTSMPVHLAVVPRPATPDLAAFVADNAPLIPVVHGWAHDTTPCLMPRNRNSARLCPVRATTSNWR